MTSDLAGKDYRRPPTIEIGNSREFEKSVGERRERQRTAVETEVNGSTLGLAAVRTPSMSFPGPAGACAAIINAWASGHAPFFCPAFRLSIHPVELGAKMVDYHNPVTITEEYCAFTFPSGSGACSLDLLFCLRNSVACEALACPGWYIYASLPALPCFPSVILILRL